MEAYSSWLDQWFHGLPVSMAIWRGKHSFLCLPVLSWVFLRGTVRRGHIVGGKGTSSQTGSIAGTPYDATICSVGLDAASPKPKRCSSEWDRRLACPLWGAPSSKRNQPADRTNCECTPQGSRQGGRQARRLSHYPDNRYPSDFNCTVPAKLRKQSSLEYRLLRHDHIRNRR